MDLSLDGKVALITGASRGIGNLVAFLASDRAKFITGQAINVDGGMVKSTI
jgi:3-oxoacyl-[acyl-carrier protein] reductase